MFSMRVMPLMALAALLMVGCERREEVSPSAPAAPGQPAAPQAAPQTPAGAANQQAAQAQSLMNQFQEQLKAKQYDAADATLKKLEDMKAQLEPAIQRQIEAARQSLTAARSASGVRMPEMPSMPKTGQ